jgi:hypothetical protein
MHSLFEDPLSERALNVLRLAVPDIPEYSNSRPALVFHSTHDHAEKVNRSVMFCFLDKVSLLV